MRVCFITAGDINFASSRMRAYWVAEEMKDASVSIINQQEIPSDVDACIWQKAVNMQYIEHNSDKRHYWDVCDPVWWFQPEYCQQVLEHIDGVVCSNEALADDFCEWSGWDKGRGLSKPKRVDVIPDRLKLSHFHKQRQHEDTDPVRFIWFGYSMNRIALWGAVANLQRLKANGYNFTLTIMDDRPDAPVSFDFPVRHVKWTLEQEVDILAAHDIALLPPYPGPWGKVKSDNKTKTAKMCGLPSISGCDYKEMESHMSIERRIAGGFIDMTDHLLYDVDYSAFEWKVLLS